MPASQFIDMLRFAMRDLPAKARVVECQIFSGVDDQQEQKPCWKFWEAFAELTIRRHGTKVSVRISIK